MIELPNADGRKKVLKCQYKGFTTYSVLPERCDKYYFDREKDIENIQIQYLSILTNPGGGHGNQGWSPRTTLLKKKESIFYILY